MRKLKIAFTTAGGLPALAVAILPALQACGSTDAPPTADATTDGADASFGPDVDLFPDAVDDFPTEPPGPGPCGPTYTVAIPPAGVVADPGQICAVVQPPVTSNTSARVTLTNFSTQTKTASGAITIPPAVLATMQGLPTVKVSSSSHPQLDGLLVTNLVMVGTGFTFDAAWPGNIPTSSTGGVTMTIKVAYTIACADGGTQSVESITRLDMCVGKSDLTWVSSGDACTVCQIIAEMAPSPIPSANAGDELPLGRVIRMRVVEVARAGRDVLLFAENDGGGATAYEWHVSGGTLRHLAPDVVLWSMPPEAGADPFGQVAIWNDEGAVVENFFFGAAA
jgi:hypothetical protein